MIFGNKVLILVFTFTLPILILIWCRRFYFVQAHPLLPVEAGGGRCNPKATGINFEACGGAERGTCSSKKVCSCFDNWTGPNCLAHDGFDPIEYDLPDKMTDIGFRPPGVLPLALLVGLGVLLVSLFVTLQCRERFDRYSLIPEAEMKVQNRNG